MFRSQSGVAHGSKKEALRRCRPHICGKKWNRRQAEKSKRKESPLHECKPKMTMVEWVVSMLDRPTMQTLGELNRDVPQKR